MFFQSLLRSGDRQLVAWLDNLEGRRKFKVGDMVTLKDYIEPTRRWEVLEVYGSRQALNLNRGWHVGGL